LKGTGGKRLNKTFLTAGIAFKEGIRNKALHGIVLIGIILFAFNIIFTGLFSWELGKVAVDMGLSVISLAGLIIIFFLGINSLSNDVERKTVYLILSRPITKANYLVGKYLGLALLIAVSSLVLAVFGAVSVRLSIYGSEGFLPAGFSWATFLLAIVFQTLSLLIVLALSVLWVTIASHPFTALLLSLISYFVGQNLENVINIISSSRLLAGNTALIKILDLISWIFPNLAAFDLKTTAAYGLPLSSSYLSFTAGYGITYIVACLALATAVFNRRELA
jgi:ABC-type transport system involved in multi-copper enzyme maturation permease subunit